MFTIQGLVLSDALPEILNRRISTRHTFQAVIVRNTSSQTPEASCSDSDWVYNQLAVTLQVVTAQVSAWFIQINLLCLLRLSSLTGADLAVSLSPHAGSGIPLGNVGLGGDALSSSGVGKGGGRNPQGQADGDAGGEKAVELPVGGVGPPASGHRNDVFREWISSSALG